MPAPDACAPPMPAIPALHPPRTRTPCRMPIAGVLARAGSRPRQDDRPARARGLRGFVTSNKSNELLRPRSTAGVVARACATQAGLPRPPTRASHALSRRGQHARSGCSAGAWTHPPTHACSADACVLHSQAARARSDGGPRRHRAPRRHARRQPGTFLVCATLPGARARWHLARWRI